MPDPTLELRDVNGTLIVENDNWRDGPELEIEETTLAPTHDLESAIVTTLPSGPYKAVIHERNGQSGVGLVEVYNLQNPLANRWRSLVVGGCSSSPDSNELRKFYFSDFPGLPKLRRPLAVVIL